MPNQSFTFPNSTGFTVFENTAGDISFGSSICSLTNGRDVSAAVRTPMMDVSGFGAIAGIEWPVNSFQENIDAGDRAYLRFLVSFDDWNGDARQYYYAFMGSQWFPVADVATSNNDLFAALETHGHSASDLANISVWPDVSLNPNLSVLIGFTREGGATPLFIREILVRYNTAITNMGDLEASPIGDTVLPINPSFPIEINCFDQVTAEPSRGGYKQLTKRQIGIQMSATFRWENITDAELTTLRNFFNTRKGQTFTYTFPGGKSYKWFIEGNLSSTNKQKSDASALTTFPGVNDAEASFRSWEVA